MNTKNSVLCLLSSSKDFVSGESAARRLGISRNSVWKAVRALRADGYEIESVQNRGYRILGGADVLTTESVICRLDCDTMWKDIKVYDTVGSTNNVLRTMAAAGAPEGTVVIASHQTSGVGRRGRTFCSPEGTGVYMSMLLRPRLEPSRAVMITTAAAVSVCEAVSRTTGIKAGIKWVNDIFVDGLKVSGMLTEASIGMENSALNYAVLGIGVNVYEPQGGFPDELKGIAGFLCDYCTPGLRGHIAAAILNAFQSHYPDFENIPSLYSQLCIVAGRRITVIAPSGTYGALALGTDENCALRIQLDNGEQKTLNSGEISIRL